MSNGKQPSSRYEQVVTIIVCITLSVAVLLVSLQDNKRTERKFCTIATAQRMESESRVATYQRVPPPTAAGKAQQYQAQRDAANWQTLERALGCPIEKE